MNSTNFEGGELTIWLKDGNNLTIPLNLLQTVTVAKILGIQFQGNEYSYYGDSTLEQFYKIKGNPLRLVEK